MSTGWRSSSTAAGLSDVTLVVQDWGGPIGLGAADAHPGLVRRVVAANTVLHTADAALAGRLDWPCHAGPDGTVTVAQALLDYQRLTQELTPFRPSLFVQGATASDVPDDVLAAYDAPFPDETYCAGPRQLPLLMGLTPASACAAAEPSHHRGAGRLRRPLPHRVLRRRPGDRGAGPRCCRRTCPGAAGQRPRDDRGRRALPPGGPRAPSWPMSWRASSGRTPPGLTTRPGADSSGAGRRAGRAARRQRVGLGRGTGAELRLQGGQLVVDLRVLADLVELLLDVVGAAAHVLEDARLEQLVEGARAGLHGGDLVLRPLQRRPRSR